MEPVTRKERILNGDLTVEPVTREEILLYQLISKGGGGGGGGTTNYNMLLNKPKINGVELRGDKTLEELGISGGGSDIQNDINVTTAVGGISASKKYTANTPVETILREMLSPTLNPSFTTPSASISGTVPSIVKVNESVNVSVSLVLNRGKIDPPYGTSGNRAGAATGYSVSLTGASITHSDSNTRGSFAIPSFTKTSKGEVTISGTINYGAGEQPKNSAGQNYGSPLAAGSVSASKKIKFVLPFVSGVSDTLEVTSLAGLTEEVSDKADKVILFNADGQHPVFAYDASYGYLSSIEDANRFETIGGWTRTTLGEYLVYTKTGAIKQNGAKYTFKF